MVDETESVLSAHILAVDDDPSVRQMIADYLGDNEIRVTTLASGREITEIMPRETIDLVVLDLACRARMAWRSRAGCAPSPTCRSSCSPGARTRPTA